MDLLSNKDISEEQWSIKRVDLLVELLHEMAKVLDYDFDKTHIKNSSYSPVVHGEMEDQQVALRKGLIDILEGNRVVPIRITNWPDDNKED